MEDPVEDESGLPVQGEEQRRVSAQGGEGGEVGEVAGALAASGVAVDEEGFQLTLLHHSPDLADPIPVLLQGEGDVYVLPPGLVIVGDLGLVGDHD